MTEGRWSTVSFTYVRTDRRTYSGLAIFAFRKP